MKATFLVVVGALGAIVACTGGSGGLPGLLTTQDPAPKTNEPVAKTNQPATTTDEATVKSGDAPTGAADTATGGGGSFSCHGTYDCTGTDGDKGSTIVLNGSPGNCTTGQTSINADGTISVAGQVYAHWSGGDGAFTFTTTDTSTDEFIDGGKVTTTTTDVVTCSKVSDSTTPINEDGGT